jgi:predicted ATPase/class 3 adenylate cyclase
MRSDLPTGTVTFLFTDVEGSTTLLHELGSEEYAKALAEHRRVLRDAFARHGGVEVDTQGDAFFYAFPTAPGALDAACEGTDALSAGPIRVRIGIHTGTPHVGEEGYVGADVHRAARIAAAGHGGQVLVSSATAQLTEIELVDLGDHRFKDLSAPERVYQLGQHEFPALRSLYRTNLPVPATPFLGRERELAEVVGLLEGTRLLTLTGPGGTGKTRLALQAAAAAADSYPDGVYWVPLAPLRDPHLVLAEAAQAVGSPNGLAEHIADKSMLLLFDNFEQVVEAASSLAGLVSACPKLDVMVTSRELLALPGEQAYPVPPLAHEEGVGFFSARASAADPGFRPNEVVGELCERLDNLPLAIELAAARVRVLSPEQLLARLSGRLDLLKAGRGVEARQQTLGATIEWSYELLTEDEQLLFARLSVFRGGCTLEAAETVCDADLDVLQALVDKSLLRFNEGRYWMLETIHEYATDRLDRSGEAEELRRLQAEYFLGIAEEAVPHLRVDSVPWFRRLDAEHDNLRMALDTFEGSTSALQLAGALYKYWNTRGHMAEGRLRLESALRTDERPTAIRARALVGAGVLMGNTGDLSTGRRRFEEALRLYERLGDAWGIAHVTLNLGAITGEEGDLEHAQRLFEESAGAFTVLGDEHWALWATRMVAFMCFERGDRARARELHEEVVRRARAAGDNSMAATSLGALAEYDLYEGQASRALPMLVESTRIYQELGDPYMVAVNLCRFALALALDSRLTAALRVLARGETLIGEVGRSVDGWIGEMNDVTREKVRSQLDETAFDEAWEEGEKLTLDEAVALALAEVDSDA